MKKVITKEIILFLIGGIIYYFIEVLWRLLTGTTSANPTMIVVGGIAFICIGGINELFSWEMPLSQQSIIGMLIATLSELISGIILNVILKMNIWDYSGLPLNFLGQICLPFSIAWLLLSIVGIILDDYLRYILFNEEKPRYRF